MANQPIYDMTDAWSSGGTRHDAIKMNVTDAASTADSTLLLLQVGGNDRLSLGKDGALTLAGTIRPVQAALAALPAPAAGNAGAIAYATGEGGGLVFSDGTAWKSLAARGAGSDADWTGDALTIAHGGTGAVTAEAALTNLGGFPIAGGTMKGPISSTPGPRLVLTGGTTAIDYNAAGLGNRRPVELRSGANTLNIQNIPESGGDLQISILYTAGSLAFTTPVRWKIGGGAESTTFGDTGVTLTAGVIYCATFWRENGNIYGGIV